MAPQEHDTDEYVPLTDEEFRFVRKFYDAVTNEEGGIMSWESDTVIKARYGRKVIPKGFREIFGVVPRTFDKHLQHLGFSRELVRDFSHAPGQPAPNKVTAPTSHVLIAHKKGLFVRGKPELLKQIMRNESMRKRRTTVKTQAAASPLIVDESDADPDLELDEEDDDFVVDDDGAGAYSTHLEEEVIRLRDQVTMLTMQMQTMQEFMNQAVRPSLAALCGHTKD